MNAMRSSRLISVFRWVARIWSLLVLGVAVMVIFTPDPYAVEPVPLMDWIELGFIGLSVVGLVMGWRWEGLGGLIAILGVVGNQVVIVISRGKWYPSMLVVFGAIFILPAILYLICWRWKRTEG